ncbi:carbonic anhydrase [Rhodobacterales bacterium 52_120_T64]|nr:carbonic anhydrase [Rhodobacterales bacterium 52_120_T64]
MKNAKPLPTYLAKRYAGWRATQFQENKAWYARLADEGQRPRAMIISCCDSRVHVTAIFGAETGEFFIHRNIANLVPVYTPSEDFHGTSAAIEYAVKYLNVANLIVVGHSDCGGVAGCLDMCCGNAPELEETSSFIGRWMDILRPGFERIKDLDITDEERQTALEKQGVLVSLENLMTFPFIQEAVENDTLSLHGIWNDIRDGGLEFYNAETEDFQRV